MKTINFTQKLENINLVAENAILIAQSNRELEIIRLKALEAIMPLVENWASKQNLEISDITFHGKNNYSEPNWTADSKYSVQCNLIPANDKFKFIQFNGYTSRGAGKNQDRLDSKANKLEESFLAITGINCVINPFSLEVRGEESKKVLLSFSI
jgi:hypothetical protein